MSCSNCNKPAPSPLPDTWAAGNDEVLCPGCFEQRGSRAIEYSYRDEHGAQTRIWQGSPAVALQAAIEHLGAVRLFAYRDNDGTVWCLTTEVLMALGAALRAGINPDAAYDSWCHDADCVAYPDGDVGQLLADEEVGEPGYIGNSVSPELRQFPFQDALVSRPLGTTGTADATTESWMRRRLTDEVVTSDGRCAKCGGELISIPVFEDPSATFSFCPGCQPKTSSEPALPPADRPGLLCPIDLTLAKPTPPPPGPTGCRPEPPSWYKPGCPSHGANPVLTACARQHMTAEQALDQLALSYSEISCRYAELLSRVELSAVDFTPPPLDLTPRWSSRASAAIETFISALVDASGHDPEAATLVEIEDLRNELLKRLGPLITYVRIAERLEPGPFSPDAHAARLRGAGKIGVLQGLYMDPDIYMVRLPDEPTDDPVAFYLASELELGENLSAFASNASDEHEQT